MVRAQLRAVLEDSSRGDVIVEAEGGNVRSAVNALFDEQPPSIEWLAQFHPDVVGIDIELILETAQGRAIRILRAHGYDARLYHSGGGIWVADVTSSESGGRKIWVTDSEGDEAGPFLVGVYPSPEAEGWFEDLSGPCSEEQLVAMVKRALAEEAG